MGDETLAIDSVLECDIVRAELLKKEKDISAAINAGYVIILFLLNKWQHIQYIAF